MSPGKPHPIAAAAGPYMDVFAVTRAELAAAAGVATSTLGRWFTSVHPIPLDCVPAIERRLGLPRGRLLIDAGYVDIDGNATFSKSLA